MFSLYGFEEFIEVFGEKAVETLKSENYFAKKLVSFGLTDEQIKNVLIAIDNTCQHCWEAPTGCSCSRDD